jgi:hypothetical protein
MVLVRAALYRCTSCRIALVRQFTVTVDGVAAAPLKFLADRSLAGPGNAFDKIVPPAHGQMVRVNTWDEMGCWTTYEQGELRAAWTAVTSAVSWSSGVGETRRQAFRSTLGGGSPIARSFQERGHCTPEYRGAERLSR